MRPLDTVSERWAALDMTVLAEHVTYGGVIDAAYQQEPDSVLWSIKYTGQLLGFTINREQDVRAWHPHRIGGYIDAAKTQFAVVESIITIPSPDSSSDELWMIVRRYINGVMVRYIEWMHKHHNEGDDVQDAFYVNSGLTLDNVINATLTPGAGATVKGTTGVIFTAGSAVFAAGDVGRFIHYRYSTVGVTGKVTWFTSVALITGYTDTTHVTGTILWPWVNLTLIAANGWRMTVILISGLTHLKGETVDVWADGAAYPQLIVNGSGQVTLPEPASKAQIGLPCPAILQPMPLEAGAQDGTAQGKTGRISRAIIRFHETIGARYGRDEDQQLDRVEFRDAEVPMDTAPNPFSGDVLVSWPDGYDDKRLITVVQDQPGPCTVVAIMPQLHTQDAR